MRVDEGFLGQAAEEVTRVLRARVPFNDSLSTECAVDPYYMKTHYYTHLEMQGVKSFPPSFPNNLAPYSKSQLYLTWLAPTLYKGAIVFLFVCFIFLSEVVACLLLLLLFDFFLPGHSVAHFINSSFHFSTSVLFPLMLQNNTTFFLKIASVCTHWWG